MCLLALGTRFSRYPGYQYKEYNTQCCTFCGAPFGVSNENSRAMLIYGDMGKIFAE